MRQLLRIGVLILPLPTAMLWSGTASAACVVKRFATLDVTMESGLPVTQADINGHPVRLTITSGAFYSIVSAPVARAAGLSIKGIPVGFEVYKNGALMFVGRANVDELKLGGSIFKGVNFVVGGSYDGLDGVIGQNILGRRDAEYDLEHGAVRLTYTENCDGQIPAYWAGTLPVMSLPIEPFEGLDQRTVGTVLVNGVKLRAMFNSTNSMSAISLKALKKLGVSPDGGGAEKDGDNSPGRQVKLDNIDIGGETLRGGTLRVSDFGKIDVDMVIGLDFFLAHRIYVGNGLRRMYFTYSKGPVFGVLPAQPNPVEGPAISSAK